MATPDVYRTRQCLSFDIAHCLIEFAGSAQSAMAWAVGAQWGRGGQVRAATTARRAPAAHDHRAALSGRSATPRDFRFRPLSRVARAALSGARPRQPHARKLSRAVRAPVKASRRPASRESPVSVGTCRDHRFLTGLRSAHGSTRRPCKSVHGYAPMNPGRRDAHRAATSGQTRSRTEALGCADDQHRRPAPPLPRICAIVGSRVAAHHVPEGAQVSSIVQ